MAKHVEVQTISGNVLEIPAVPTIGELRGLVAEELGVDQEQVKLACDAQLITDNGALLSNFGSRALSAFLVAMSVEGILHSIGHSDINGKVKVPRGGTVLHFAAVQGNLRFILTVLEEERFELFNATDSLGRTAIQIAAQNGHIEIIKVMLADSRICKDGALHAAAAWGRSEMVNAILADPCCDSQAINSLWDGRTVLHEALRHEHIVIVETLLQEARFTSLNNTTESGGTALHIAAMHGDINVVVALLTEERFTEVNAVDARGHTALHRVAASTGDYSMTAKAILDSGRFTMREAKDLRKMTALDIALENRNMKTAEILKTFKTRSLCSVSATPCRYTSTRYQGSFISLSNMRP